MRVVVVVQARMESTRLPGKSLMTIDGKPLLVHVLERAKRIDGITDIVLTTPNTIANKPLGVIAQNMGVGWWSDDHSDLLACFVRAARDRHADVVVRITGDCPRLEPSVSGAVIQKLIEGRYDYCSNDNILNAGVATDGWDTEAMTMAALEAANAEATSVYDRHHVTAFLRENTMRFRVCGFVPREIPGGEKWSVDTLEDLRRLGGTTG